MTMVNDRPYINLRALREKKGWTKSQAAIQLGFSRTYYSDVESGKHGISLKMMHAIMREFLVEYEDFYRTAKTEMRTS